MDLAGTSSSEPSENRGGNDEDSFSIQVFLGLRFCFRRADLKERQGGGSVRSAFMTQPGQHPMQLQLPADRIF